MNDKLWWASIVAMCWVPIVVGLLYERHVERKVFANLDHAYAGRHFDPGNHLHAASCEDIAYDLSCHATDFEEWEPERLMPYVQKWIDRGPPRAGAKT